MSLHLIPDCTEERPGCANTLSEFHDFDQEIVPGGDGMRRVKGEEEAALVVWLDDYRACWKIEAFEEP